MKITKITEGITQLSVNVENILFESLWEMPNGVSINSYVVKGERIALIDGVCGWDGVPETLFELLDQLNIKLDEINYLILNHLEPDHAGWITELMKLHKNFEVLCSDKGAELFKAFFHESVPIRVVNDGDTLDLGNGKTLAFHMIPHVHWPDAMVTYSQEAGILFSCDAFGSFGKLEKGAFDDDYDDEGMQKYEQDTIRYYSNIVGAFSPFVLKAIDKLSALDIKVVAPGHGLMWRSRVNKIIQDYADYARYQKGPARKEVTLIWGSMYGMTEEAVHVVMDQLERLGVTYHVHQVPNDSWGDILTSVWTSSGVILGMPTYEYKMFPPMSSVLEEIGKKKSFGKKAFRFGSYGWSGGAQKELDEITERFRLGWSFIEPHEFKGKPSAEDLLIIRERVKVLVDTL